MYFVFGLLLVVAILFATEIIRADYTALMALCILVVADIVPVAEALKAFGNTTVIMVAALFVVSRGLSKTGVTQLVGSQISRQIRQGQTGRFITYIMLGVGSLGSFMSSTGIVALFIPIVERISRSQKISSKKILLPLAYAGLISGMMTLIATPPNLIVAEELQAKGYEPFTLLSFTPFGIVILMVALVYMLLRERFLGKEDDNQVLDPLAEMRRDLLEKYHVFNPIYRIQLAPDSLYDGLRIGETDFRSRYGMEIIGLERKEGIVSQVTNVNSSYTLKANDILIVSGEREKLDQLLDEKRVVELPYEEERRSILRQRVGLAEIMIPFGSTLEGKTVAELGANHLPGITIMGSSLDRSSNNSPLKDHKVKGGESLLVWGRWEDIRRLDGRDNEVVVFNLPMEKEETTNYNKAYRAMIIGLGMVVLLVLDIFPPVMSVLLAALAMVAAGCLTMDSGYRSISWPTVVLVAALLPFADALERTGGVAFITDLIVENLGGSSPYLILAGIFVITVALGMFVSNTATAVILAPIALEVAEAASFSPYPFLMGVAIACSCAFITPVASPVNLLVVTPGGYTFNDFVRAGLPLAILALLISVFLIPLIYPF